MPPVEVNSDLSVIIPVYNDPTGIKHTIETLVKNQFENYYEILIVDNNSTDTTYDTARSLAGKHDEVHVLVEDEIQSSYAARNTGLRHSSGDILVFIDANITVDPDWLTTIATEIKDEDYLTYDVEVYVPDGQDTWVARYNEHTSFPIEEYAENRDFGGGGCIAVRRKVFEDVGRFDHRLVSGGDAEFGHRVAASGRDIRFTPETHVYHPARTSLRSQIKKEIRVGRGFCQLQRYYPDRYGRPGIPPRPSGSGDSSTDTGLPILSRLVFRLLGLLFLGCRGIGYLLELVAGDSRKSDRRSEPTS